MMRKLSVLIFVVVFGIAFTQISFAQGDIEFGLVNNFYKPVNDPQTAQKNLDNAIDPILDMFGFLSGGGLYNTADVHGIMGFDVGIKLTAMRVSDDQKPPFPFPDYIDEKYQSGPLADETIIPLPMLHVGVGLFSNLELMGRFFTYPMGKQGSVKGNVTLIGVGAKYGLLQNFALPKIAVVAAYHYLTVPDEFDFGNINNISGALVVSKGLPFVSFYGGLGIDYTTLKIDLPDPFPDPDPYTKTNFRGNIGLKLTPIPFVFINLDYNFGAVQGLSAGAGISIR